MTTNELKNEYFDWMYELVYSKESANRMSYQKLLRQLNNTDFYYLIGRDANRNYDGIELRYRFAWQKEYDKQFVASCFDDSGCSLLEMMVALAVRCEENIMCEPGKGDQTSKWFWVMIDNLGLKDMDDLSFDPIYTDQVTTRLLNREYAPNGMGGLFTVSPYRCDLRNVEIWYQMCWYLNSIP